MVNIIRLPSRETLATIVMQPLVAVEGEKAYNLEKMSMVVDLPVKLVQFVWEYLEHYSMLMMILEQFKSKRFFNKGC